ncbi:MAG: hypothetical protein IT298_01595 [Chloroflexi bacterium]|jgi:hypothetical protein|nr:MAG: hypothetical protein UZ13_03322 [Chloroflexi bacterium OLB13]MBC6956088.1 hypothetical protein [Chloroflexota bacterium]MBV6435240.1 hypothetical protein [Anaerolineae bacterium]MDL1915617.1 hypothetical protein [Anaerolineae bacterium CFX4]OQY83715.1 MAG: hypothetical protein B6D42_07010 [Anaerolineae bacterium UTCFX5]
MASRLNPVQMLSLIGHTAPAKFELIYGRETRLVFYVGGGLQEVATSDLETIADVREAVQHMGYRQIDEWRRKGEGGYVFVRG